MRKFSPALVLMLLGACGGGDDDESAPGDDDDTAATGDDDSPGGGFETPQGRTLCDLTIAENSGTSAIAAQATVELAARAWAADARLVQIFSGYIPPFDGTFDVTPTGLLPDGRLNADLGERARFTFVYQSDEKSEARDYAVDGDGQIVNADGEDRPPLKKKTLTGFIDSTQAVEFAQAQICPFVKQYAPDWALSIDLTDQSIIPSDRPFDPSGANAMFWTVVARPYDRSTQTAGAGKKLAIEASKGTIDPRGVQDAPAPL